MPEFSPDEQKNAMVPMTNPTAKAFDYSVKLYMGTDLALMAQKDFHLETGEEKDITLSIIMPSIAGTYPVHIGVFSAGVNIALYKAEDITITPLITEIAIDFPSLSILNVEGVTFSDVTVEDTIGEESVRRLTACIQEKYSYIGDYASEGVGIKYPGAAAQYAGPCPWIRGVNLNTVVIELTARLIAAFDEHPEWLYPYELEISEFTGNIRYKDNAYAWATGCAAAWYPDAWGGPPLSQFQIATLSEPIVVDKIRGITFIVQGRPPTPYTSLMTSYLIYGQQILTINTLRFEPQFSASKSPPEFEGSGNILADIERNIFGQVISLTYIPCEITANSLSLAGHYYPGVYDGVVSVSWGIQDSVGTRVMYATYNFRIKNLMRVTGEGVV